MPVDEGVARAAAVTAPLRVAVIGKGGAGKSVIAGTMARLLARRGEPVLALDADPLPGLSLSLGSGPDPAYPPLLDAVERDPETRRFGWRAGIDAVVAAQRFATGAPDGVRLLTRGKPGPDGAGKLLGASQAFWEVAHGIVNAPAFTDWNLVGDLPAGPYLLAEDFAAYARAYLVVVQPTVQSALTGRRVARLARARTPDADVLIVANRVSGPDDVRRVERSVGEPAFFALPVCEQVAAAERAGRAPIDHAPSSPAIAAIDELVAALAARTIA